MKVQRLLQAIGLRVSEIGLIERVEQVHDSQGWENPKIELPHQSLLCSRIEGDTGRQSLHFSGRVGHGSTEEVITFAYINAILLIGDGFRMFLVSTWQVIGHGDLAVVFYLRLIPVRDKSFRAGIVREGFEHNGKSSYLRTCCETQDVIFLPRIPAMRYLRRIEATTFQRSISEIDLDPCVPRSRWDPSYAREAKNFDRGTDCYQYILNAD